jgi:ribonuclease-3
MSKSEDKDVEPIEKQLSLNFRDKNLLRQALIHSSHLAQPRNLRKGSNEQLATIGDAVLNLTVAAVLYRKYKERSPYLTSATGDLTIDRSRIVRNDELALLARITHLDQFVVMSPGQMQKGLNSRILAQTYEALVGAIFLDGGYEAAASFVRNNLISAGKT